MTDEKLHIQNDGVARREFLRLMGASLSLGGLGACTQQPSERIYPYARYPEQTIPGRPRFFATAMPFCGGALPLLVESHMGRPTKIEGNPEHPASLGRTSAIAQASVLELYDPERSKVVKHGAHISSWPAFLGGLQVALDQLPVNGEGLRLLTPSVLSPTLAAQIFDLQSARPAVHWHQYEPVNRDAASRGAELAFDEDAVLVPNFAEAKVVLSIDADFLTQGPAHVRNAAAFAARRRPHENGADCVRLYSMESSITLSGADADHRLPLAPHELEAAVFELARKMGVVLPERPGHKLTPPVLQWIQALAKDLLAQGQQSLVLVGELQPPALQALGYAMNAVLNNAGHTADYIDPVELQPENQAASLSDLTAAIDRGEVKVLVVLGGNPAYTTPTELGFEAKLAKVPFSMHLALYEDETSAACEWHVPEAHFLEAWSDSTVFDGGSIILQPLIAPLYEGRSAHEVVAALNGLVGKSAHDLVQAYWKANSYSDDFETYWQQALHDGWVPETAFEAKPVAIVADLAERLGKYESVAPAADTLALIVRPDPTVWDGRFANNGWLQELPKPLTKLTWDNAALLSPKTAARLGLKSEDRVEMTADQRKVSAPLLIVPGHADDCVTLHLGYGRRRSGSLGTGIGVDAFSLLSSNDLTAPMSVSLRRLSEGYLLARPRAHESMEGRDIARSTPLAAFLAEVQAEGLIGPAQGVESEQELATLNSEQTEAAHAWGMVIDLSTCTGCNACVLACQSENNIPVVGKEEVLRGREMHWIRIDRYFDDDTSTPRTHHQPVACMQCEDAPCELVCPVGATAHSSEGLNDMVYNRCIGTRYCEANCPYKVRRFNFYQYADFDTPSLKMQRNPDVTVRSRGVMEKCTYCVQRINESRIAAQREGRPMRDGEITTACQQVCPSTAITFGDLADPSSRVSKLRSLRHDYGLLAELGVRPRTTYLSRIQNPNPDIEKS